MNQFQRAVLDLFDYGTIDVLDSHYDLNDLPFIQKWELCRAYVDDPTTDGDDTEWLVEGNQTASDIYLQSHYLSNKDLKDALDQLFIDYYWPIIHDRVASMISQHQQDEIYELGLTAAMRQRWQSHRSVRY